MNNTPSSPMRVGSSSRSAWSIAGAVGLVVAVAAAGTASAGRRQPVRPTPPPDAQAPAVCNCPAPVESTFALVLVRAQQNVVPQTDFSESSTGVLPVRGARETHYQITSVATFFLPDDTRGIFSCTLRVGPDKAHLKDLGSCTLSLLKEGATEAVGRATVPTAEITALDDTHVQYALPLLSFTLTGGETVNVRAINFRTSDPAAHFTTPPRAMRP